MKKVTFGATILTGLIVIAVGMVSDVFAQQCGALSITGKNVGAPTPQSKVPVAKTSILNKGLISGTAAKSTSADAKQAQTLGQKMALDVLNEEIKKKGGLWHAGKTKFLDMPLQDLRRYTGSLIDEQQMKEMRSKASEPIREELRDSSLPDFFDWRGQHGRNYITPARDQGGCGSCWAFATIAAVEGEGQAYYNNPDLILDLSEQDLISCCTDCSLFFGEGGCNGGYIGSALDYMRDNGAAVENCFAYTACDAQGNGQCTLYPDGVPCENKCPDWQNTAWGINAADYVTFYDIDEIKNSLITKGPLIASMDVYEDFFYYTDGIYQYEWGDLVGTHAVTIVGYGTYDGIDYWIVKNSWGPQWGMGGFFFIKMGDSHIDSYYAIVAINSPNPPAPIETICNDNDADGYCNWGLGGEKPADCPVSCAGNDVADCNDWDPTHFEGCGMMGIEYGTVEISSTPAGAHVYVLDILDPELYVWVYRGDTPLSFQLFPGQRTIEISKPGYHEVEFAENIGEGQTVSRHFDLESVWCGLPIMNDLTLESDITGCSMGSGPSIGADNITLDCNGHSIVGLGAGTGISINNKQNVMVKNCTITNFTSGIEIVASSGGTILNNQFRNNSTSLLLYDGASNNQITQNTSSDNAVSFYLAGPTTSNNVLTNNSSCNATFTDFWCENDPPNNTGSDNYFNQTIGCPEVLHERCPYACGDVVAENLTLTHDLTDCPDSGLVIGANGITLDCNGHTISGTQGNGGGVYANGWDAITIKNCIISGFNTGVVVSDSSNGRIENNQLYGNHVGINFSAGSRNNQVVGNTISNNLMFGIGFGPEDDDNVLTGNSVCSNGDNDLYCFLGSDNAGSGNFFRRVTNCPDVQYSPCPIGCGDAITQDTILDHAIAGCPINGLTMEANGITLDCAGHAITGLGGGIGININTKQGITIRNCRVSNFNAGITLVDASQNIIENNQTNNNVVGINLSSGSSGNQLTYNSASNNTFYGIGLGSLETGNTFTGNAACDNTNDDLHCVDSPLSNTGSGNHFGQVVGCSAVIYGGCLYCGNGTCEPGEFCNDCPGDCGSCPGGGGCFLINTLITMADGSKKPIQEIKVGDQVMSFDEKTKQFVSGNVTRLFVHPDDTDEFLIVNGDIFVTKIHRFYKDGKWVAIGKIKAGDNITKMNLAAEPIKNIKHIKADSKLTTYNFEVEKYHTYIAGGYVVHNRKVYEAMQEGSGLE